MVHFLDARKPSRRRMFRERAEPNEDDLRNALHQVPGLQCTELVDDGRAPIPWWNVEYLPRMHPHSVRFRWDPAPETTCRPPPWLLVWAFSVGTNAVCTILIGWKARQHRKVIKQSNSGGEYHGISVENDLSLLVESGLICTVCLTNRFQIIQITGFLNLEPYSPLYYFVRVLVGLGRQMTGLYPTLIIVIVNFRRTIWEAHPITVGGRTGPNSLQWAVNTNRSGATRKPAKSTFTLELWAKS
ncbi:hypothetical protein C8R45DRAFT_927039 [Mycena sanguinolenta]|nr:hypothetical protein C8R45DRAFT_927039 [Mycena sanguinolenta]